MSQHKPADDMQINRVTLSFCGRHANLEALFRDDLFYSHLRALRIGSIIASLIVAFFGIYDAIQVPQKTAVLWTIRWAVISPLLLLFCLFTFSRHFKRFIEPTQSAMILSCGLCMIALVLIAQGQGCFTYTNGLVQLLFFVHTLLKLRFIWRAPTTLLLIAFYVALALGTGITPKHVLVPDIFNLACINTFGMVAAYIIEYRTRRNFYLGRQLESKKRRLAIANQYLEERVAKRTTDLSHTNELLKDEIHERKSAENALRKSESRFRRMVDNVSDYMCVHDLNGNILDTNLKMIEGLGYSQPELKAINLKSLLIPEQQIDFDHYLNNIRREGRDLGKMTLLTKGGLQRQFEYSNVLAEHTSGQEVVYSLARDITQHQRTEKALAESQASFKSIFEISAAGMMIVNAQTRKVVEVNPAAADMVGAKIDLIKGAIIDELITMPQDTNHEISDITTPHPIECALITQQQAHIPILKTTKATAFHGQAHWIISFVNMQKIKEAEEAKRTVEQRLNQAQHLQSIGTLAGGIAHDFNNILFGMLGFAELALDDATVNSLQAANIREILQGGKRAKEMINQILTFSRQDNAEKHPLQPMPLIKEALKLLRASIPTTIDIQFQPLDRSVWIEANATQIHQAIMNLCTNAAHSMSSQGGSLIIKLDKKTLATEKVTPHGKIPSGSYARISISDTGTGMLPDLTPRIFEPFFTTKAQGEGTGMGLSVTLGIIQAHGGTIGVKSQVGKGSRFDILLPVVPESRIKPQKSTEPIPSGNEHILYVDDEKPLTIMMERLLKSQGYQVTTCQNGIEALELFKRKPHLYDLIISDLTMPKMTGTRLASELLKINPDLPIMLCTGYGDKITKENVQALGIRDVLFKPIRKREIAFAIRQALDSADPSAMARTA